MSVIKSLIPRPNVALPIEGTVKSQESEARMAVLECRLGFQAREFSITNIFFKTDM